MNDCVEWTGSYTAYGYGKTGTGKRAHRAAWEAVHGPIPTGLNVCHKCDNRACVNVDHLFLGTAADNVADKVAKGRQAKGSKMPQAKLTEYDVSIVKWCLGAGVQGKRLAELYGVTPAAIAYINCGKSWRHVPAMEYRP